MKTLMKKHTGFEEPVLLDACNGHWAKHAVSELQPIAATMKSGDFHPTSLSH